MNDRIRISLLYDWWGKKQFQHQICLLFQKCKQTYTDWVFNIIIIFIIIIKNRKGKELFFPSLDTLSLSLLEAIVVLEVILEVVVTWLSLLVGVCYFMNFFSYSFLFLFCGFQCCCTLNKEGISFFYSNYFFYFILLIKSIYY